jgi:integrase/recombinase XerC
LVTLTWGQIDRERAEVTVTGAVVKNHHTRHVPLSETARQVLEALARSGQTSTDRVFGYRSINVTFQRAVKRAGLQGVTPHTLRRTFATRALEGGVNIRTVQRWLGHSSIQHTQRYVRPSSAYEREAIERLQKPKYPWHRVDDARGSC